MFAGRSLCNDFYCDCDFCESFGAPEVRRSVFEAEHGRATLEANTNLYEVVPSEACDVGFITGRAQGRLLADGRGKAQEQQDLQDAMYEDAYRLVGADDAAECVFQYMLGFMVGMNAGRHDA